MSHIATEILEQLVDKIIEKESLSGVFTWSLCGHDFCAREPALYMLVLPNEATMPAARYKAWLRLSNGKLFVAHWYISLVVIKILVRIDFMTYNQAASSINKEVLIEQLKLKQDSNTVFFENDHLIVISPSAQNDSWWFDLLRGNIEKATNSKKSGLLIIRFLDKLLVTDLKSFLDEMVQEVFVVKRQKGQDNWKFNIRQIDNEYIIINNKNSKVKYPVKLVTNEELVELVEDQFVKGENSLEIDNSSIPSHIHTYLTQKGFLYSQQNIANLYLSLRSKPFVILSGISGTGKTKVVQLFANAVGATQDNGRYQLIPVRPDWSDSSDLLGYTDLKGDFVKGQLTEMVIRASENPDYPHFVVLDEMNLARVEYYLSEFLSVIESRDRQNGKITTSTLVRVGEKEYGLPNNLYIIGTVNMDETTYPFSKKVLDRANSIEFNDINLTSYSMLSDSTEEVSPVNVHNDQFASQYLFLKEAYSQYKEIIEEVSVYLEKINKQLQLIYAQVGYRVRDEICFYMIYNEEMKLLEEDEAMDFCIMQKILPRISGAGTDVEDLLKALFEEFAGVNYKEEIEISTAATYPQSAKKVQEMLKRLGRQGFTSFWVS
ncbi:MAG: AAA family ATPase [Solibacillus sp.]